eukprot:CAMPEP_0184721718 /NCGR_PEP_ID=MMETSP0314-20130426/19574_1 /TAXON_ID=38298 /ORGANISM="Rhodella maculata, Strain CCMP 736" /LENGTH=142 /DNA_ID=CAMNT_0027186125 /DNA_START=42 /DNA_END=470 /DNA_ORIENTATION=+
MKSSSDAIPRSRRPALFHRILTPIQLSTSAPCRSEIEAHGFDLFVPASPRFPDADRFTPRTNAEMFGSEYSTARDLGLSLSPRNNRMTGFEKKMASDERARRFVRPKVSNKGSLGELVNVQKNRSSQKLVRPPALPTTRQLD